MAQKNFYLILDLSVDPPEEDPEVIEKAIKKKQAQWSRYRNHPTKGIKAKHLIDLIPEIRKVMFDPALRRKHAENARIQREKEDDRKYSKVDRHLRLFLNKGSITNEEAYKLMKHHGLEVEGILKRAIKIENALKKSPESTPDVYKAKQSNDVEAQLVEIENHLSVRMYKGYITEKEIEALSKVYGIEKEKIKSRITYPIREVPPKEKKIPVTIDKSISKSISDNLSIVDKSSLYAFLGVSANADLGTLQKKAGEKRKMMLATTQKNAVVTAGGELAGHCITIFKSPESRTTYDVSRAVDLLKSFEQDIEIVQVDGSISLEYYEAIIESAVRSGIEPDIISEYVEDYCNRKNYKYKSGKKQKRLMIMVAAAVGTAVVLIVATVLIIQLGRSRRLNAEYAAMNQKVAGKKVFEEKKDILSNYLTTHAANRFTEEVKKKIKGIENEIKKRDEKDARDYADAMKDNDTLYAEKKYEELSTQYNNYIKGHPTGVHADEIRQKISALPGLMDDRAFERLKELPEKDYDDRLTGYQAYLDAYPKGKHRDAVHKLISDMRVAYLGDIKIRLEGYEKKKEWEKCIALIDTYFEFYKDAADASSEQDANALKGEQLFYKKQDDKTKALNALMNEVRKAGSDNQRAMVVYRKYLKENPKSPIRYEVKKQMALLKKKIDEAR